MKISFSIIINAPRNVVWKNLWSDEGYRKWTAVFMQGSYAVSDWKEGSEIKFLSPKGDGMFGIIKHLKENEQMSFEHHGEVKNGVPQVAQWAGFMEEYKLHEKDAATELVVEMDATDEFKEYFQNVFPKALEVLKENSEQQTISA